MWILEVIGIAIGFFFLSLACDLIKFYLREGK